MEKAGSDDQQTVITNYFEVVDKISLLAKENQKLEFCEDSQLQHLILICHANPKKHHGECTKNIGKNNKQCRHTQVLKQFATLLYINA